MRRPTPLPPPAAAPTPPAAPPRPRATAPADAPGIEADGGTEPLTPLRPRDADATPAASVGAAPPAADETAPIDAHGRDAGESDEPGDPAPAVGLREVWRAARARRRALRAEVRRFTVRQRRRRMLWLGVAVAAVLLVAGTVGAAYSPIFAVRDIQIVGTSQLDATAVQGALAGQLGTPLPLVDESAVKAALVQFPLVESYTLEAVPPNALVVRIVERTPVGAIASDAGYTVVDAAGVALSTSPTPPAGQPILTITGGTDSPAFRSAGQVMRALPADVRAQVTEVTATTADDVALVLGGTNTRVVWGSADESALKGVVLARLMQNRPPQDVSEYDVSSPEAAVVR